MQLILIRHGDAENAAVSDFDRRLTAKGREQAARAGRFLREAGLRPAVFLASPYLRARETAAGILAELPGAWGLTVQETPELGCGCAPQTLSEILENTPDADRGVLAVGHQPDCGEIVEYFCHGGQPAFKKCCIAVLELYELRRGGGELRAFIPPELQLPTSEN